MKETISEFTFIDRFDEIGRKDNFSREARRALFAYYEELEESCEEELEFDPIAICCDWSEYDNAFEAASDYTGDTHEELGTVDEEDEEAIQTAAIDWLHYRTQIVTMENGGILVQAF